MTDLKKLKEYCEENGFPLEYLAWSSFLALELGKSYKPTIDQLDDLYVGLVNDPFDMGMGPEESKRNSDQAWYNWRREIIHTLGGMVHPYEEWKEKNPPTEDWLPMISKALEEEKNFMQSPEDWAMELRKQCGSRFQYEEEAHQNNS